MFGIKSWKVFVAVGIAVVAFGMSAYGGPVPQRINYQGTLSNKAGGPANGSFNMTFRIYSTATGTTPLWSESWNAANSSQVVVTDGVFNVMLGSLSLNTTPLTSEFFATYPKTYLGVVVANDSEMLPRQMIASVGYAFAAGNGVPKGGIIMWSGTTVPEGWALCDGANGTPNLKEKFIIGASATYSIGSTGGSVTIDVNHTHNDDHNHSGGTNGMSVIDSNSVDDNDSSGKTNVMDDTDHSHSFTANWKSQQGLGATTQWMNQNNIVNKLPPYYALAFIMKL